MKRAWAFAMLALAATALALASDAANAADKKGTDVTLDGVKSTAPADWAKEKPANLLRYMQFKIPRAKDDVADGELVISRGIGGSEADNYRRWKDQFIPPEGKKIDDVAKLIKMKIAGSDVNLLDVSGTYKYKEKPIDPDSKAQLRKDYRMLAVQFEGKDNTFHIKLVGPAKTVEAQKKAFEDWLKGFK